MTVAASAYVWSLDCDPTDKLILLAFAECGEPFEQLSAFRTVSALTGFNPSTISRKLMGFVEQGLIVNKGERLYEINVPRYMRVDPNRSDEQTPKQKQGYVYLINEINGDHYKIGRTVNPESRLKTFQNVLPYQVEYEALIETDDMFSLESNLHQYFADKRIDGEWFALEADDVAYIKSMAVQS